MLNCFGQTLQQIIWSIRTTTLHSCQTETSCCFSWNYGSALQAPHSSSKLCQAWSKICRFSEVNICSGTTKVMVYNSLLDLSEFLRATVDQQWMHTGPFLVSTLTKYWNPYFSPSCHVDSSSVDWPNCAAVNVSLDRRTNAFSGSPNKSCKLSDGTGCTITERLCAVHRCNASTR